MNFKSIAEQFDWISYSKQFDRNVTYIFVFNRAVSRLRGESDILYIGETEQSIRKRYEQETRTKNTAGNTQQTNIRTTFILEALGLSNVTCYYAKTLNVQLGLRKWQDFMAGLKTWDKKTFLRLSAVSRASIRETSLEKYLLAAYARDHLEVPPMNNRM